VADFFGVATDALMKDFNNLVFSRTPNMGSSLWHYVTSDELFKIIRIPFPWKSKS